MTVAASAVTLSGWGQPHDALSAVVPQARHIRYGMYDNVDEALYHISQQAKDAQAVVGWSLGAQLAVRAVANGLLSPNKLVLIAPPFRFVAGGNIPFGMGRDTHAKFHGNYKNNPQRTLSKAWELVVKDDSQHERVRGFISQQDKDAMLMQHWHYWLGELEQFTCEGIDFSGFPPTLLIHGDSDVVIDIRQSRHLKGQLPSASLVEMQGCGHAPHWHDPQKVAALITEHLHV